MSGGASYYPSRHAQLAAEPAHHPRREESGGVELRLLHLGPERHDDLPRRGHPAMRRTMHTAAPWLASLLVAAALATARPRRRRRAARPRTGYDFDDSHFHLTNYIQEGTDVRDFLRIMGTQGRPVHAVRHPAAADLVATRTPATSRRPTTCRPTRRSTTTRSPTPSSRWRTARSSPEQQARFDPMITGFNPGGHVRRGPHPPRAARPSPASSPGSASSPSTRSSCRRRWRARWRA